MLNQKQEKATLNFKFKDFAFFAFIFTAVVSLFALRLPASSGFLWADKFGDFR